MAKTEDGEDLLRACLQDLHAGKRLLSSHLPRIAKRVADAGLRALLEEVSATAARQAVRLEGTGHALGGPGNLWMDGILRDGRRDTRRIARGPLLDVALVGAIRKAFAAEIVSGETAIAVAKAFDVADTAAIVTGIVAEEQAIDQALAAMLVPLTNAVAALPISSKPGAGRAIVAGVGVSAMASLVGVWTYWAIQDRNQEDLTQRRLGRQETK